MKKIRIRKDGFFWLVKSPVGDFSESYSSLQAAYNRVLKIYKFREEVGEWNLK